MNLLMIVIKIHSSFHNNIAMSFPADFWALNLFYLWIMVYSCFINIDKSFQKISHDYCQINLKACSLNIVSDWHSNILLPTHLTVSIYPTAHGIPWISLVPQQFFWLRFDDQLKLCHICIWKTHVTQYLHHVHMDFILDFSSTAWNSIFYTFLLTWFS